MIKKTLVLVLLLVGNIFAWSQNAVWQIRPEFDSIDIVENAFCIGHKNDSTFFWRMDGSLIHKGVRMRVATSREGVSVLQETGTSKLLGLVTIEGQYFSLAENDFHIVNDYPYYSDGYLLVKHSEDNFYLDKKGKPVFGPFVSAYPFSHGIALVTQYQNPEKKKNEYFDYISSSKTVRVLPQVNRTDIDFASSVNDEGYAIVVMNKKVFKFDVKGGELEQMSTDGTTNKKSRVTTMDSHPILMSNDGKYSLALKQGQMLFDNFIKLKEIRYDGIDPVFVNEPTKTPFEYSSRMTCTDMDKGMYGILYDGKEFLPHQFKAVHCLTDNLAIVSTSNGTGILRVYPTDGLVFQLNNNKKIGFLHPTYQTKVVVKMPTYMKAKLGKIMAVNSENMCIINNTSRNNIENEEVTAIEYECELHIPHDLPTEEVCNKYHFYLDYDGIRSKTYEICASMWYVMQYVVEITKQDFSVAVDADEIEVEFQLAKSSFVLDSDNMNHSIFISVVNQDNQEIEYSKIRENLYSFKVKMEEKEQQTFNIRVNEEGCPYVNYPHTIIISQIEETGKKKPTTKKVQIKQKKKLSSAAQGPVVIPE